MKLLLVFCVTFGDKRSTFFREIERRRNYTGVFLTMKKRFYRELTWVFGFKVQGANHYTLEPDEFTACVLLEFGDKRSTFSRENKHRRNYTGIFVTMKKRFYRDLNSGLRIHTPRC